MLRVKPYVREFRIPSVRVSIAEVGQLVDVIGSLFPASGTQRLEISFKRTDGREVIAEAVTDITEADYLVPSVIAEPSISVFHENNDGETTHSVHLRRRVVPIQGGTAALPYMLSLESIDETWIGHSTKVLAWLRSHMAWYSSWRVWIWCLFALAIPLAFLRALAHESAPRDPFYATDLLLVLFSVLCFVGWMAFQSRIIPYLVIDVRPPRFPIAWATVITIGLAILTFGIQALELILRLQAPSSRP